jgi:Cytochrome P460
VAKKPGQPVEQMHNVYARAKDIQAYRKDGKFSDGAVLVKEITNVSSGKLTSGQPSWSTDVESWFVMVKDAKGRFPKNDLWGDGWGWALFEAKDPKKNVATSYKTDCLPCHAPARKDDWLYVRGYRILAKPAPPK